MNIPAILWWEGLGAAIVTILSQGIYSVLCLWWARDLLVLDWRRAWTVLAALLSALGMGVFLSGVDFAWWWETPIGAGIYLLGLLLMRAFSGDQRFFP